MLAALALPAAAWAHGFDERYDLPAPLGYFVTGAALTVALSFVVAGLFARRAPSLADAPDRVLACGAWLRVLRRSVQAAALLLFLITVSAALWGTADPMMNLAPTLVWIIWWVGLALFAACIGNPWPALDPWGTLYEILDATARRLGRPGIALGWAWPRALGAWPAVALLLAWSWLEVVYPVATVPRRLGLAALLWSAVTLTGMLCFGRAAWQRNADVFALYFATLGRMAPLAAGRRGAHDSVTDAPSVPIVRTPIVPIARRPIVPIARRPIVLVARAPGAGLISARNEADAPAGSTAFVIAMLATVLFDGLHGGSAWLVFEAGLKRIAPQWLDVNGYAAGSAGLLCVWLGLLAAYAATCLVSAWLGGADTAARIARRYAPTLVPIAVAYNIAHNFSSLLIQGQNIIALLSDPYGRQWNLLGTANHHVNIGLVDARLTWYVAIAAIVAGHIIAVWLAHRVALRESGARRASALAALPLTVLMVAYTAVSLLVLAEPMVSFDAAPAAGAASP